MNRRELLKSLAAISAAPVLPLASEEPVGTEMVVKVPICIDVLMECVKEREIPGYVPKEVAWADLNLETGEWTPCPDDDPIYQHKVVNDWWR